MATDTWRAITDSDIGAFRHYLESDEKAAATVEKYCRDVRAFARWIAAIGDGGLRAEAWASCAEAAPDYKRHLLYGQGRNATGVNAVVAALNAFFGFMQWNARLKPIKIQRQTFRAQSSELTRAEYERLLTAAEAKGNERLNLVMQTICSTGIRVSELQYVTVDAVKLGEVEISNKGKTRTVFFPQRLRAVLRSYATARGLCSGCVFITKSGRPLNRSNIWADMKKLCDGANVDAAKVFPHNLRALFARLFYSVDRDIIRLADILGHSDVNTTRIYLMESGDEHRRRVELLGLVVT